MGFWIGDWIYLSLLTHDSSLQELKTLSLIYTFYKSRPLFIHIPRTTTYNWEKDHPRRNWHGDNFSATEYTVLCGTIHQNLLQLRIFSSRKLAAFSSSVVQEKRPELVSGSSEKLIFTVLFADSPEVTISEVQT
jgi:hypothetical protein